MIFLLKYFRSQQNESSMTDYFASFKRLVEELNSVLPITTDAKIQQEQRKQMAIMKFLARLKSDFEPIRSQILRGASFTLSYCDIPACSQKYFS